MASSQTVVVAIGTENKAKINALRIALEKIYSGKEIVIRPAAVNSGVSAQPLSDAETIQGAQNRAKAALEAHADALFGVGLEGGINKLGDRWYEGGWIAVTDRAGAWGIGSTAKFELSKKIVDQLLAGKELAEVIDEISGLTDVRSSQGAMGMVTNGLLPRDECYAHGVYFAFAPFISDSRYWK